MSRVTAARIDASAGSPAQRKEAVSRLNALAQQAKAAGFINAALEARLALGEVELNSGNQTPGRKHLEALQEEASGDGFQLMVQKVAMALGKSLNQAALHVQN